jgi:hypothetical protein
MPFAFDPQNSMSGEAAWNVAAIEVHVRSLDPTILLD